MDEYKTLLQPAKAEFVERRSRFIGHACPVQTEEEATAFIEEKKRTYWEANHNVYAYILRQNQIRRYSDDGEPQGTAGVPVLDVLQKEGLVDLVVVVTRYFGGVLLGAGGLVRAYSHSAKIAVDAAGKKTMSECIELALSFGYDFYGKLSHILPNFQARTTFSDFGADVTLHILLKACDYDAFLKVVTELSAARVVPELLGSCYDCME